MTALRKFFQLTKIDEGTRTVCGIACSEAVDSDGEIADYPATKAAFTRWSEESLAATKSTGADLSLGNIRVMHSLEVGGKAVKIEFDDQRKQVVLHSTPANDKVWDMLKGGFLCGYSIGGSIVWSKPEGSHTRYAPKIAEVSYVDRPANPDATFAFVRTDGSTELRKFQRPTNLDEVIATLSKVNIGSQIPTPERWGSYEQFMYGDQYPGAGL